MDGVKISQTRWPTELYERIKERAYRKRQSINSTVVEIAKEALRDEGRQTRRKE